MFWNKKKFSYPFEMKYFKKSIDKLDDVFLSLKPHKGTYLGTAMLWGSFICDNDAEIFETLEIGEKLFIEPDPKSKKLMPKLSVYRQDRTFLGNMPVSKNLLPLILLQRNVEVWCHVEVKSFEDEYLDIGVSIYCDNY